MSVYIRGMDMPTSCSDPDGHQSCPLFGSVYPYGFFCKATLKEIDDPFLRQPWCPIVPIQPHGDLIDRDEYRDEFMNGVYALCSDDPDNYRANAIIGLFDAAPTIIEA